MYTTLHYTLLNDNSLVMWFFINLSYRFLAICGAKGHVSTFDWQTKKQTCENNVMETCHDIKWVTWLPHLNTWPSHVHSSQYFSGGFIMKRSSRSLKKKGFTFMRTKVLSCMPWRRLTKSCAWSIFPTTSYSVEACVAISIFLQMCLNYHFTTVVVWMSVECERVFAMDWHQCWQGTEWCANIQRPYRCYVSKQNERSCSFGSLER